MEILSCCDSNFVIPMGVMLHSICVNNNNANLNFHVIIDESVTNGQQEELRKTVGNKGNLSFYLIDIEHIKQYLVIKVENFPRSVYYRLLMADVLPSTIHKILYLDADIIVRKCLDELWNRDVSKVAVAGVRNQSDGARFWERLEYPKEYGYFNSGVLLFNLDFMRKHQLTKKMIDFIIENPKKLLMPDQDVLNYVLKDCKLDLDLKYNVQEGFYRVPPTIVDCNKKDLMKAVSDPVIVHFTKEKPWTKKCNHPLKDVYYSYKQETIWAHNMFMEQFHYPKLRRSLLLRMKIVCAKLFSIVFQREEKIKYMKISLKK